MEQLQLLKLQQQTPVAEVEETPAVAEAAQKTYVATYEAPAPTWHLQRQKTTQLQL